MEDTNVCLLKNTSDKYSEMEVIVIGGVMVQNRTNQDKPRNLTVRPICKYI